MQWYVCHTERGTRVKSHANALDASLDRLFSCVRPIPTIYIYSIIESDFNWIDRTKYIGLKICVEMKIRCERFTSISIETKWNFKYTQGSICRKILAVSYAVYPILHIDAPMHKEWTNLPNRISKSSIDAKLVQSDLATMHLNIDAHSLLSTCTDRSDQAYVYCRCKAHK